jgi:hypothetical protein
VGTPLLYNLRSLGSFAQALLANEDICMFAVCLDISAHFCQEYEAISTESPAILFCYWKIYECFYSFKNFEDAPQKSGFKNFSLDINILVIPQVEYMVPCDVHQCVAQRMVNILFIDGQFRVHLHLHTLCLQNDRSGHVWINQPDLGPVRILFNCGYT